MIQQEDAPLCELFIAAIVGAVSDKFGLPATSNDTLTPSGFELADDPDMDGAKRWCNRMCEKFQWIVESKMTVQPSVAMPLIRAAIHGDDDAALQLFVKYGRPQ